MRTDTTRASIYCLHCGARCTAHFDYCKDCERSGGADYDRADRAGNLPLARSMEAR